MARKDISMTPEEVVEFLSTGRKTLQVATIGKEGVPHVAPMWFVVDDGKVVFRSFTKSQKIVNLQRDQRLTVLVETGDTYETLRGVMITGAGGGIGQACAAMFAEHGATSMPRVRNEPLLIDAPMSPTGWHAVASRFTSAGLRSVS